MNEQSSANVAELPSLVSAEETHYDYIVIGSGAGGGPLAARLALAGQRVLVIEAGSDTAVAGQDYPEETYTIPAFHAAATEDTLRAGTFPFAITAMIKSRRRTTNTIRPWILPRPVASARVGYFIRVPQPLAAAPRTTR
ncbi:NAD(P)-binding protein [Endobacterium cereale]|uniref:NAD(P)-binding protein n=1 Tax=Endobacterium cereale TaxID=2663029 RepID=UPI002B470A18|nr:NAD(P)-binding protein [Endobacterium cereale]MEB2844562.1 NAD(P)-binding protein [Endobacterium cereale]